MKNLTLLVWVTQLGLSVAMPIGGFVWLAVWLRQRFELGGWVVFCGVFLGVACAANGLKTIFTAIRQMVKSKKEDKPPVSFNDHD